MIRDYQGAGATINVRKIMTILLRRQSGAAAPAGQRRAHGRRRRLADAA
jgi:hypothetical protein